MPPGNPLLDDINSTIQQLSSEKPSNNPVSSTEPSTASRLLADYGLSSSGAYSGGKLGFEIGRNFGPWGAGIGTALGAGVGAGGGSLLADYLLKRPLNAANAGVQALITALTGPLGSQATRGTLRATQTMRPLTREVAADTIASKLLTPEALAAKEFYRQAELKSSQFTQAQDALSKLRTAATIAEKKGELGVAKDLQSQMSQLTETIEGAFPGFKGAQVGYHRLRSVGRAQELVEQADPLVALERDISKGRVTGTAGDTLLQSGGRVSQHFSPGENQEIKDILTKLGPNPGSSIWHRLLVGHTVGALGGVATGTSPYLAGTAGGAMSIAVPKLFNSLIAAGLKNTTTRAFLKRSIQDEGAQGLANPQFWHILGSMGARLGIPEFMPQGQNQ